MELWKKYIGFEKSNPLRSEDTALVTRRVMFATEQCLLVLTHHPAVWHQAAQYLDQSSKLLTEKGVRILHIHFVTSDTEIRSNHRVLRVYKTDWRIIFENKKSIFKFNQMPMCSGYLFQLIQRFSVMNVTFLGTVNSNGTNFPNFFFY